MNAYLIDPHSRTVTAVEHDNTLADIYRHIGADCFDVARCFDNGDALYVDDSGLDRARQAFFTVRGYGHPLAGKALCLGCNERTGASRAPRITLEQLRAAVSWVSQDIADTRSRQARAAAVAFYVSRGGHVDALGTDDPMAPLFITFPLEDAK